MDISNLPLAIGTLKNIRAFCIDESALTFRAARNFVLYKAIYDNGVEITENAVPSGDGSFSLKYSPVGNITCDLLGFLGIKEQKEVGVLV